MDKFELLADLADGMLDGNQEQELYAELAINDELRAEFKQLLTLNSTIKNNSSLFVVDNSTTNAIFGTLGIPITAPPIINNSASGALAGTKVAKLTPQIISAGVATLTTAALFLLFFNFYGEKYFSGKSSNNAIKYENPNSENIAVVNSNDDKANSLNKIETKLISKEKQIIRNNARNAVSNKNEQFEVAKNNNYLENKDEESSKLLTKQETNTNFEKENELIENNKVELATNSQNNFEKIDLNSLVENKDITVFSDNHNKENLNVAIEVRGFQNWHTEKETISPAEIADFNNTGVSAILNLDENFSIGVEMRQETFFQKFSGLDKIGQFTQYEQQPNFTTYGMIIRYGINLSERIKPLAQIAIGGTNVGFIGRAMSGIQYKFSDELKFIIGFEYSNLFYDYQNHNFNSDKVGFNYGISYNF